MDEDSIASNSLDMDTSESTPTTINGNGGENGTNGASHVDENIPPLTVAEPAIATPPIAPSTGAPTSIPMPFLQQAGEVFVGPGSQKEAQLLGLGLAKLRSREKDKLYDAKRYAMDISIKQIMLRQQQTHQQNQQKQQMYGQALSLMARVYIGSISFEVREENLRKAFEPFGPIKSINMSWDAATGHHKGFAFMEFEVPEAALLAQEQMNGVLMGGRNLKVGRPSNVPQAQSIIEMVQADAKKYYRVYVSSVHPDLSENDVKSVFSAFGEVIKCQLARQSATGKGSHRGFGYIEFNNGGSMTEAIAGMNMFDLGGQFLRVGRCITPPEALNYITPQATSALPQSAAVALAAITAQVHAMEATGGGSPGGSTSPGQNSPARQGSPAPSATSTVPPPSALPTLVVETVPTVVPSSIPPPPSSTFPPVPPPPPAPLESFTHAIPPPPPAMNTMGIPPPPQIVPPPQVVVPPVGQFIPPPSVVIPPPGIMQIPAPGVVNPSISGAPNPKKKKKIPLGTANIIDRIQVYQYQGSNETASFAPLDDKYRPRDALDRGEDEEEGGQLAIGGGQSSSGKTDIHAMALSLVDGGRALATIKAGSSGQGGSAEGQTQFKKKKVKQHKVKGPKLSTEAQLAAAEKAGAMHDAITEKEMNSEEATLASQEGLEIRGNESRHLLMTKLMRINRSNVMLLKNMVGLEDTEDPTLDEEIKEECSKYGTVDEVVIAKDIDAAAVKIFVKFADATQVDKAKSSLDGRYFAGRTIIATVYDQAMFDHGDYSG